MAMLLEKKFPTADIYFVKHGPPRHNLHTLWKAGESKNYKNFIGQYKGAMEVLKETLWLPVEQGAAFQVDCLLI